MSSRICSKRYALRPIAQDPILTRGIVLQLLIPYSLGRRQRRDHPLSQCTKSRVNTSPHPSQTAECQCCSACDRRSGQRSHQAEQNREDRIPVGYVRWLWRYTAMGVLAILMAGSDRHPRGCSHKRSTDQHPGISWSFKSRNGGQRRIRDKRCFEEVPQQCERFPASGCCRLEQWTGG